MIEVTSDRKPSKVIVEEQKVRNVKNNNSEIDNTDKPLAKGRITEYPYLKCDQNNPIKGAQAVITHKPLLPDKITKGISTNKI